MLTDRKRNKQQQSGAKQLIIHSHKLTHTHTRTHTHTHTHTQTCSYNSYISLPQRNILLASGPLGTTAVSYKICFLQQHLLKSHKIKSNAPLIGRVICVAIVHWQLRGLASALLHKNQQANTIQCSNQGHFTHLTCWQHTHLHFFHPELLFNDFANTSTVASSSVSQAGFESTLLERVIFMYVISATRCLSVKTMLTKHAVLCRLEVAWDHGICLCHCLTATTADENISDWVRQESSQKR